MTPDHEYIEDSSPKRKIPAWAMSMFLHVVLVLLLGTVVGRTSKGTGDEPDRPVGIAVAHRMADRTEYALPEADAVQSETEQATETTDATTAAAAAPPALAQPLDVSGLLAQATETPTPDARSGLGSALDADSSTGTGGQGQIGDGGPQASTMFFGVSGSGRKFVYVFDRSESMNSHDKSPLRAAKREIIRSMGILGPEQTFQLVFYNNEPDYFRPTGHSFWMLPADETMKRRAETFVRSIQARGGTNHYDALKMALQLEPDVIFFLTDARIPQLNRRRLDEIRARSERSGTTIHAIEFGEDLTVPQDSFLRTLAAENGGEYRYLNVAKLSAAPAAEEAP